MTLANIDLSLEAVKREARINYSMNEQDIQSLSPAFREFLHNTQNKYKYYQTKQESWGGGTSD